MMCCLLSLTTLGISKTNFWETQYFWFYKKDYLSFFTKRVSIMLVPIGLRQVLAVNQDAALVWGDRGLHNCSGQIFLKSHQKR